jgi:exopolysaccharide biosynthesis protein
MLVKYYELNKKKKEIELEMNQLKDLFQDYFNKLVGPDNKAEITINGYKLQRQIRKIEKYNEEVTVKRLEELQMNELVQVVKKPDDVKIKSALQLGLLSESNLEGCIVTTYSPAISVKTLTPR